MPDIKSIADVPVRGQAPGMQMVDANASAFFVTPTGFNNVA